MRSPFELYEALARQMRLGPASDASLATLAELSQESVAALSSFRQVGLTSRVDTKEYRSFTSAGRLSRPVNSALFDWDYKTTPRFYDALLARNLSALSAQEITQACYTTAIAFCCVVDLAKKGDQKTPGTFFERWVCHLFSRTLGVAPSTQVEVLDLGLRASLPTDFIFDLGPDRPKFHLPVKTSTRERVIRDLKFVDWPKMQDVHARAGHPGVGTPTPPRRRVRHGPLPRNPGVPGRDEAGPCVP